MSPLLQKMLDEIEQLSPEEQLALMGYLVKCMKKHVNPSQSQRKWSDLKGMAPYPLFGEDAQDWVSRSRKQGDEHREWLLRGEE